MTSKPAQPKRSTRKRPSRRWGIASIIDTEMSFINGWSVSDVRLEQLCLQTADKILTYLRRMQNAK